MRLRAKHVVSLLAIVVLATLRSLLTPYRLQVMIDDLRVSRPQLDSESYLRRRAAIRRHLAPTGPTTTFELLRAYHALKRADITDQAPTNR
jgi:hypothetical protein